MAPQFQGTDIPLMIAVTIDCADARTLSAWWAELLGVEVAEVDEPYAFLAYPPDRKVSVWFQQVQEPKAGKNRVHVDFAVSDLAAFEQRLLAMGGSAVAMHTWKEEAVWWTCRDPEGNEFDVMQAPQQTRD